MSIKRSNKSDPKGTKSEPNATKSEPKVSQSEPKVSRRAPKGSQKGAKSEPRDLPKHPLRNKVEKVRKMLPPSSAFGVIFGDFSEIDRKSGFFEKEMAKNIFLLNIFK